MAQKLDYNPLKENDELIDEITKHWNDYLEEYDDKTKYVLNIIRGLIEVNHHSDFALDYAMYDADLFEEVDDDVVKRFEANREAIKQIFKILGENACGDIWNNEEQYNEWVQISEV